VAQIRPFTAIRFAKDKFPDVSNLIAPPYDVLNEPQKQALQKRHPNNIVTVDLPYLPPKTVGPDEVYQRAATTLQSWLASGILQRDKRPALYPYAQTYKWGERTFHRRGFLALVKLSPFGEGDVVPHEKTYAGAIEDRLKLMRFTGMQLSPVFGLFSDPRGEINQLLYSQVGKPEQTGTIDNIQNDIWAVPQAEIETQVIDAMKKKPVYIADGHHRYTTALQYQKEVAEQNGGKLPLPHPANYCLFDLVPMQDDGLLILPTHRLIGNLVHFELDIFRATVKEYFDIHETLLTPAEFESSATASHTFGLYDGVTKKLYMLRLKNDDILKPLQPNQSDAWRRLDVAILQHYLLDVAIGPEFAKGELLKGYTADPREIPEAVDGHRYQLALMVKPTPLSALEELGKTKEVMPQKSTFFYPKLATGMVINPLS
jgi:uncharacterized protein (DUF1015 family)